MKDEIESLSYEAAYQQLEEVLAQLESGEPSLEASVKLYERGQRLSAHCQRLLEEAELKIRQADDVGADSRE